MSHRDHSASTRVAVEQRLRRIVIALLEIALDPAAALSMDDRRALAERADELEIQIARYTGQDVPVANRRSQIEAALSALVATRA